MSSIDIILVAAATIINSASIALIVATLRQNKKNEEFARKIREERRP